MSEKEYFSQRAFADHMRLSPAAINKAIRPKNGVPARLQLWEMTGKIYLHDPLTQAFINNPTKERLNKPATIPINGQSGELTDSDEDLKEALTKVNLAQSVKTIEEAELKKQSRIGKEMDNAYRRGELVSIESIEKSIMTWFDRWLNSNKRGFNGSFDDFMRGAFKLFENESAKGDERPHEITRSELKQKWINLFESWADDGKQESMKRLQEIQIEQGKKK